MYIRKEKSPYSVTLPNGKQMTRDDLPPAGTRRWVASRKVAVVIGVQAGLISQDDALDRYDLTEEEFAAWVHGVANFGLNGLKTTQLQKFRVN